MYVSPDARALIQAAACAAVFAGFLLAARLIRRAAIRRDTPPPDPLSPAPRLASDPELPMATADGPAMMGA